MLYFKLGTYFRTFSIELHYQHIAGQYVTLLVSIQCILSQIHFFFLFVVNRVGCIYTNGGNLTLQCNNSQRIQVVNATMGQSSLKCYNEGRCCPSVDDYHRYQESTESVKYLKDRCDGRQTCVVLVGQLREVDTDYELVNYICRNDPICKHPLCIFTMKTICIH